MDDQPRADRPGSRSHTDAHAEGRRRGFDARLAAADRGLSAAGGPGSTAAEVLSALMEDAHLPVKKGETAKGWEYYEYTKQSRRWAGVLPPEQRTVLWLLRFMLANPSGDWDAAWKSGGRLDLDGYWAWVLTEGVEGDLWSALRSGRDWQAGCGASDGAADRVLAVWAFYGALLGVATQPRQRSLAWLRSVCDAADAPARRGKGAAHTDAFPNVLAARAIATLSGMPEVIIEANNDAFAAARLELSQAIVRDAEYRARRRTSAGQRAWSGAAPARLGGALSRVRVDLQDVGIVLELVLAEVVRNMRRGWFPITDLIVVKVRDVATHRVRGEDPDAPRGHGQRKKVVAYGVVPPEPERLGGDVEEAALDSYARDEFEQSAHEAAAYLTGLRSGGAPQESWTARVLTEIDALYGSAVAGSIREMFLVAAVNWQQSKWARPLPGDPRKGRRIRDAPDAHLYYWMQRTAPDRWAGHSDGATQRRRGDALGVALVLLRLLERSEHPLVVTVEAAQHVRALMPLLTDRMVARMLAVNRGASPAILNRCDAVAELVTGAVDRFAIEADWSKKINPAPMVKPLRSLEARLDRHAVRTASAEIASCADRVGAAADRLERYVRNGGPDD